MIIELNPGDSFKLKQTITISTNKHLKFNDVKLKKIIEANLTEIIKKFFNEIKNKKELKK